MSRIGYQRISTAQQHLDRQVDALESLGLDRIFSDIGSGKNTIDRQGLKDMLAYVREGDVVYIEAISRLARNVRDLLAIVETLEAKKVQLISLKEKVDTSSPTGVFLLQIIASMAELERSAMLERQKEGFSAARGRGRILGRPRIARPSGWQTTYTQWKEGRITAKLAMDSLRLSRTTFYRLVKEWESKAA